MAGRVWHASVHPSAVGWLRDVCGVDEDYFMTRSEVLQAMLRHQNEPRMVLLQRLEDCMPPLLDWPKAMQLRMLCPHLKYQDRLQLVWFLLGNGLPPSLMVDWFLSYPPYISAKSRQHVAGLIRAHAKGEFDGSNGQEPKLIWNVTLQQATPCHTPSFARETNWRRMTYTDPSGNKKVDILMPGAAYWSDAAARL